MAPEIIAAVALLVSVISFYLNHRSGEAAERHGRMPVLVFYRPAQDRGIVVSNVDNGPAINIVIAQAEDVALEQGLNEHWFNPIHLTPIPASASLTLDWDFEASGIGARFTDALGTRYTVKMSPAGARLFEGLHLPAWEMSQIPFVNELSDRDPAEHWMELGPPS